MEKIIEELQSSIQFVQNFLEQTTGQKASQAEIANVLKKYFVLNEIKDTIVMERSSKSQ
ncbi:MAG: hypothetical protein HQK76_11545 [Desulfobacterales bacterium]|nr:hypothetical protein [Desulfobacterales bacterium]